jgi:hypothetical protein
MLLQQNVVSQTEGQTKWINILDLHIGKLSYVTKEVYVAPITLVETN